MHQKINRGQSNVFTWKDAGAEQKHNDKKGSPTELVNKNGIFFCRLLTLVSRKCPKKRWVHNINKK